jgi:hypothetical protein
MHEVDQLLCNASDTQLRNVLAMVNLSDSELIALFEREAQITAREILDGAFVS